MADGDLTSVDNAVAWLAIASATTAQRDTLTRLVSAVTASIEAFLGYAIAQADYTRFFDGTGGNRIMLPDRPVRGVSGVVVEGQTIQAAAAMTAPGFVFDEKSVTLRGYRIPRGIQNVAITYTAGWDPIPPDIEQACLEWVSGSFQAQLRDPALIEMAAGDTKEKYAPATTTLGKTVIPMPTSVFGALAPYRRVSM